MFSQVARRVLPTVQTSRTFSSTVIKRSNSTIPFILNGRGTGVAQHIDIVDSKHVIKADAYASFGGADSAPSPLALVLSGLGSCTQVTGSLVAKELGIKLGEWKVNVAGHLDPAVLATGAEGNANFKEVRVDVEVQTNADEATFAKFRDETERRCPVSQLYKRSGLTWTNHWKKVDL